MHVAIAGAPHGLMYYATISWGLQNTTMYQPSSFNLQCFNDELQHTINLVVNNKTFTTQLGGFLPSATNYICCISATHGSNGHVFDEVCIRTQVRPINETSKLSSSTLTPPEELIRETSFPSHLISGVDNRTSIVGGVLGFIIAVLLSLLAICGGALLFLLRSRSSILKR